MSMYMCVYGLYFADTYSEAKITNGESKIMSLIYDFEAYQKWYDWVY